jgi:hypothetical protein
MKPNDPQFIEMLLASRLGLADDADGRHVEQTLRDLPDAQQMSKKLEGLLRPLTAYRIEPPPGLAETICARLEATRQTIKFPQRTAPTVAAETAGTAGSGPLISLRELLSLAAAVALFVGVLVPGYHAARVASQRQQCLEQMRVLGNAYTGYAEANAGILPFSGSARTPAWRPDRTTPLPQNYENVQLLWKGRHVSSPKFLECPTSGLNASTPIRRYSTQLFIHPFQRERLSAAFPIASDPNPLVHDGRLLPTDGPRNADVHGRNAGQSVLWLGGEAGWRTRPTVGIANDDIFRFENVREYSPGERLNAISDSFLIP